MSNLPFDQHLSNEVSDEGFVSGSVSLDIFKCSDALTSKERLSPQDVLHSDTKQGEHVRHGKAAMGFDQVTRHRY